MSFAAAPALATALPGIIGGVGDKKGQSAVGPGIVSGFEQFLPALQAILGQTQAGAAPFGGGGKASASQILGGPFAQQQLGLIGGAGQALQGSGTFENALGALNQGISGGFGAGITGDLLNQFNELQRPGLDLAGEFLTADVFEGAARAGTTRSSGTTESLARGLGQIEAGGAQAAGQFAQGVAPSAIGAQLGAITQGLGLPGNIAQLFAGPIAQQLQAGQFQQGLQGQAFSDVFAGIPIQEGRLQTGKGKTGGGGGGGGKGGGKGK